MKKLIFLVGVIVYILICKPLSAQSSMWESEKERQNEEKRRAKALKKQKKQENVRVNPNAPNDPFQQKQKKQKIKNRKGQIPKASAKLSAENNQKNKRMQQYRKKTQGLTKAEKNRRNYDKKRMRMVN